MSKGWTHQIGHQYQQPTEEGDWDPGCGPWSCLSDLCLTPSQTPSQRCPVALTIVKAQMIRVSSMPKLDSPQMSTATLFLVAHHGSDANFCVSTTLVFVLTHPQTLSSIAQLHIMGISLS